ncbi:unnamed protein product [Candidula unifasciata]|uniref:DUF4211 domain-containing protein n=1 Tax=Candidula unifasciata TaxID=100452 RepID=A0A8S3ZPG0_9EUPU|nr:unnamed protein product [Candidula unifasciata]
MDPNHWNTYNLQYGHSTPRLGLSHALQSSHGSLGGRPVSAIPTVSYSGLAMPILDPIAAGISASQSHKTMSLASSQLMFEQQLRGAEQQSQSMGRYDGSKSFRTDGMFGAILSDVSMSMPSVSTVSPTSGSSVGSLAVSKSNQQHMHDPPPAHSSSSVRLSSMQRNPHASDILYGRGPEALIPSSLAQISSLYNSVSLGKQSLGAAQQQSLSRQTPVHTQHGFSSNSDIEDLSSNSQNQIYTSYASLAVSDSQDFSAAQLSGEISYEAVSPAPINESSQNNPEHSSFSIVQFPELINLTPEHAHTLADKFQENDFRLKVDSRIQQHQDALNASHQSQRHELGSSLRLPKDMSSFHSSMLSMQVAQRGGQFQPNMTMSQSLSQLQSASLNSQLSPLLQGSLTTMSMSMQQSPAPISVQAPADSTTKPKRSRGRKKKGEPTVTGDQAEGGKKSSSTEAFSPGSQQQSHIPHHSPILNMPLTSQHVSTLPMGSHSSSVHQSFRNPGSNQFTSRDAQRAQTPSMQQTYSVQDHQNHGYAPIHSPKISHQNLARSQSEFALPNSVPNEKPLSQPSSCKQQKKSGPPTPKSSSSQSGQMFRSNIPDNQQHIQNFASHAVLMGNSGQQRGSPMQEGRSGGMSRVSNFDNSQQKMACQMSPLGQPSPQGSIGSDASGFGSSKIGNSGHMMGSVSQTSLDSRPVSVEPTAMSHAYEQGHSTGLIIDSQDPGHFQIDFSAQPFLEQLVGVQPAMGMQSSGFTHTTSENGEVVFTTLVTPAENARLQQQHNSATNEGFRPTYHGEPVHEIQAIGPVGGHLGMEDGSFNAFFDSQREMEQQSNMSGSHQQATPEPERMTLTFMPHVAEDDELGHFSQISQPVPMVSLVKREPQEPGHRPPSKGSFQESFLSYLQGHKQETLSSVSASSVTKKPQLPKYIPEPRRPKPPPAPAQPKEKISVSDAEDSLGAASSRVKDSISSLSDNDNSSHKSESDREGYSVQRTSELAVRITLPKNKKNKFGPFAELSHLKQKNISRDKEGLLKRKRKKGKRLASEEEEDYMPGSQMSEDDADVHLEEVLSREPTPPPARTSIGRKAKDKCIEKTRIHGSDSSSEEPVPHPIKGKGTLKKDGSDKDYDSDKDPVWMPFELDLKQGHEIDEKRKKAKRPRTRTLSTKSSKSTTSHKSSSSATHAGDNSTMLTSRRPSQTAASTEDTGESFFKTGMYVIEKKDAQNYENYPLWRLEPGHMMRKFEMRADPEVDGGAVRHCALGTMSTWVPSMENQFVMVKVRELAAKRKGAPLTVEVLEEYRPKPPSEDRLQVQYENDPVLEPFNIYLQVFLSLALEPTFLSAILETNEKFYIDALNQIDGLIEAKCKEITGLAHWKSSFQEYLHMCPLMKEIDRPNLKQACQASENSSPPTIKSVLLSGHPYDRFLLTDVQSGGTDVAQEFMIGKVAAYYVRPYHSLYHFKYWLRQRCEARVATMKDSSKSENLSDEVILDKCLENRSWVLQIFDSLKSLLQYGSDAAR